MSRNAFAQLVNDYNRREFDREESARERAAASSMPTYDELRRERDALAEERDQWRDAYMELAKLTNVPEC